MIRNPAPIENIYPIMHVYYFNPIIKRKAYIRKARELLGLELE